MLSKEVCQRCLTADADDTDESSWDSIDERMWLEGRIYCPIDMYPADGWHTIFTTEEPPKHCRHMMEHAVAAGMNDAE